MVGPHPFDQGLSVWRWGAAGVALYLVQEIAAILGKVREVQVWSDGLLDVYMAMILRWWGSAAALSRCGPCCVSGCIWMSGFGLGFQGRCMCTQRLELFYGSWCVSRARMIRKPSWKKKVHDMPSFSGNVTLRQRPMWHSRQHWLCT